LFRRVSAEEAAQLRKEAEERTFLMTEAPS